MTRNSEEKMVTLDLSNSPERRSYDTLKGVILSLNTGEYVRSQLERMLDDLYSSWYKLKTAEKSGS